ncbi:MAG: prepilin-type N-terminal cleavage/methylation domain-containing protein [Desulfobacterales bacterium]|nr:prepilin-type N-terminal cleavage/methylation domain-containing protein [Desulfobacterales bacterium]
MNRNGFTLLEILIATFILAVVLSTIYASYTGTFRIVNQTESEAEIYRMACITFERIIEDLESVYAPQPPGTSPGQDVEPPFKWDPDEIQGNRADTLHFFSRAHLGFGEEEQPRGTTKIDYYVEEGDQGEGLVLYRRDRPRSEDLSGEGGAGLPLCKRLVSVDFTCYNAEGEEWKRSSKEEIPGIVSISLEFVNPLDPEAPVKFFTSVALPMSQHE